MYRMWFLHSSILNTCMSSTSWLCGNELGRANTYLFPTCSHSFELYLEVKLLNHMVVLFLMVILFSIVVFPFNNPIHTAQGSPFLHILASTCNFLTFYTSLTLFFFYSSLLNGPRAWVDSTMLSLNPVESQSHHACWGGANLWSDASMQASPAPRIHTLAKCDLFHDYHEGREYCPGQVPVG